MEPPTTFRLFAYGTLQLPDVLQAVIGQRRGGRAARLMGYRCFRVPGKPYPAIVRDAAGSVPGLLYEGLGAAELALLDFYEGDLYERHELLVHVKAAPLAAMAYVLAAGHGELVTEEPWDLPAFEREHLADYLRRLGLSRRAP